MKNTNETLPSVQGIEGNNNMFNGKHYQFFGTYTPEELELYAKFEAVDSPVEKYEFARKWNAVAQDLADMIVSDDYMGLKIDALEQQLAEVNAEIEYLIKRECPADMTYEEHLAQINKLRKAKLEIENDLETIRKDW